jgi:enoyl-CoA hydratase/carnithine racemase
MSEFQHLIIDRMDHITTVQLHRPDKSNALTVALMHEIITFCEQLNEDTDTRVVIFTGAGKNFSTGMDLSDPGTLEQQQGTLLKKMRNLETGPRMIKAVYNVPQITIAAINGKALGGGACIASACDFRIGASNCSVGYPESRLGMNLSWLGLPLCTHLVGPSNAKRMVILGQQEGSDDLLKWGFLDHLATPDSLMGEARAMAAQYAAMPPVQAQMIKRSVNQIVSALDQAIMHMDKDQFLLAQQSKDFGEGISAFLQGREPKFTGD